MPMPWTKAAYFFETLDEPEASREPFCGAYITGEDSINLYDVTGAQAYLWLPDASRIPGWVLAAPGPGSFSVAPARRTPVGRRPLSAASLLTLVPERAAIADSVSPRRTT